MRQPGERDVRDGSRTKSVDGRMERWIDEVRYREPCGFSGST